ncbi:MAG: phosphatidate cytidylyltransferase [Candidatus Woesearchaeota archaeon]
MRTKKNIELNRQLFHLFFGIFIIILLYFSIINLWMILILFIVSIFISIISKYKRIPIIDFMLRNFDREGQTYPGNGAVSYLLGIILTLLIFDTILNFKNIALASIAIMVVGDSVATMVGIFFGRTRNPLNALKTLEGSIAGIIFAFLAGIIFVHPVNALFASIISMIFEAVDKEYFKIDDNIIVPLTAGVVLILMIL